MWFVVKRIVEVCIREDLTYTSLLMVELIPVLVFPGLGFAPSPCRGNKTPSLG